MLDLLLQHLWKETRRRRIPAKRPSPLQVLEEHLSPSGRYKKVVVFAHESAVMRLEVFKRIEGDPIDPEDSWAQVSGPSFVDAESVHRVVKELLRAEAGESVP